jgi:hypothetical protein
MRTGLLVAWVLITGGCSSPPAGNAGGHPVYDEAALRGTALDFWEVKEQPPLHRALPTPRVAIVEFSVQFVPPDPPVDVAAGIRLELPGLLYGSFVDILREQGRAVKPLEEVSVALSSTSARWGPALPTSVSRPARTSSAAGSR